VFDANRPHRSIMSADALLFVIPEGNLLLSLLVILSAAKNPRICL
jgi:hypothetical protein